MAIIKNAKNINIVVKDTYTSISKVSNEESEEVIVEALKENLEFSSQKRVIKQGFGKESELDKIDEENESGKPSLSYTTTYNENIIVVGAEVHDKATVNKLMFMAQAVRRVKISSIQTALYFKHGYSQNMIYEFEKSLHYYKKDIKVLGINNISELFNYINFGDVKGKNDCRTKPDVYGNIYKMKNIYIYSHGMPSRITFMLDWDVYKVNNKITSSETAGSNELDLKNYVKLNANSFSKDAEIWSYACRTGIDDDDSTDVELIWGGTNSLAQKLANNLKINVHAFARRSLYEDTWGSSNDRILLKGADLDEKIFPKGMITYDDEFRDYKRKEKFLDENKYPWQPQGAYRDVKAGNSPVGPPKRLIKYAPEK